MCCGVLTASTSPRLTTMSSTRIRRHSRCIQFNPQTGLRCEPARVMGLGHVRPRASLTALLFDSHFNLRFDCAVIAVDDCGELPPVVGCGHA